MATWVRSNTNSPSATDDVPLPFNAAVTLDAGTAPADFDPANVTSVRIQYDLVITGLSDDNWTDYQEAILTDGAPTLATVDGGNQTRSTNSTFSKDITDNSPSTSATQADWENATMRVGANNAWALWNKSKGPDGTTATVNNVTITITYTAAVTITPGLATTAGYPTQAFAPEVQNPELYHFRWAEDSTLTSPTWAAAEDSALYFNISDEDHILFYRWGDRGNQPSQAISLWWRKNGGTWTEITNSGAGNPLTYDSANVTNGGSWAAGSWHLTDVGLTDQNGWQTDISGGIGSLDLLAGREQENVQAVRFSGATAGDYFEFALRLDDTYALPAPSFFAYASQTVTPGLAQSLVTAFDPKVYHVDTFHARWSTDTTPTAPSWQSAEDGPLSIPVGGSTYLYYHLGGVYGSQVTTFKSLSYRKNGGAWASLPSTNAAGPHRFDSTNITDNALWSTANFQLTAGPLTPASGRTYDTGNGGNNSPIADTEFEWVHAVEFEGVVAGDVFDFAFTLAGDSTDPETHSLFMTAYAPQVITPGLATSPVTAFDPTVATGGDYIFPDLAQSLATAFAPTLVASQAITPPLAQQLVTTSAPTLTREALLKLVAFELTGTYVESAGVYITPGLAQQLVTTFAPTLVWEEFITPGLASSITQAFDPTLVADQAITPELAQSLAQAFDPTIVWEQFVTPDLATSIAVAFDPILLQAQAITPGLAQSLVVAFDPTLVADQAITPALAQSLVVAFDPTLAYTYDVAPGLATSLVAAFDPTVVAGPITLTPDLASSLAVGFDPTIVLDTQYVLPGLASSLVTPFGPLVSIFGGDQFVAPALTDQLVTPFGPTVAAGSVSMTPGLAQSLAQAFDPTLTTGATTITPGLAQTLATAFDPNLTTTYGLTPGLASNVAVAFDPSIVTGSVSITPGLATSLAQAFDPTVALGADYLFPDLAQQLVVAFDPSGIAQTQNIAPPLTSSLAVAFDPFVDLGTKYVLPALVTSLVTSYEPVVMYWLPTLPGTTTGTPPNVGVTDRADQTGKTSRPEQLGVTTRAGRLAYTDPET